MGTVAVLALILEGLVDQRMVKEGLVLLYPGLHTMLRLQLLLYSDNRWHWLTGCGYGRGFL